MKPSKNFYQWDINQKFTECDGRFVDFIINEKVVYRVDIVNGECIIPDEFLQKSGYHTVYECMSDYTIQNHMFPVHPREKPPGYVYTPTEKLTFEGLVQKVNDTVADIIHRADTGEFDGYTPVKGEDYFTEAEKNEMVQSVSSGAVGEFREVVNSATSDFNKNSSAKTNEYNTNAEKKLSTYNSNDAEKLKAYNDNHTEKMTAYDTNDAEKLKAYNDNHTEKMTAYDTNDADKLSTYNRNAAEKMEAYNQNHTAKVAEYNQNAETKTAEFDANAAAMQTEVDRLRGECDQLAAENRKQENRISALMKLNKGQTYDILPEEGETASRTAPSGAKYVSVDKVGGKSVVWNQHVNGYSAVGITHTTSGGVVTITPTSSSNRFVAKENLDYISVVNGHKYLATVEIKSDGEHDHDVGFQNYLIGGVKKTNSATWTQLSVIVNATSTGRVYFQLYSTSNTAYQIKDGSFNVIDLTQMFGSTIANYIYSLEQSQAGAGVEWFKKLFPDDYYPYSEPTIISSQTDRVDVARADGTTSQHITTGFPALNSAGSVYDYIDLNEGKLHRRVGVIDLGTIEWSKGGSNNKTSWVPVSWRTNVKPVQSTDILANILCDKYYTDIAGNVERQVNDKTIAVNKAAWVYIYDSAYVNATPQEFKTAMSGVMLYYELAEELITDIEIPTELTDWLDVEAGGSVTFHDADESKQLAVPNAVSWVRKLDEVE